MTLPGGTPIGKYIVRRKLAEGGMAEIYVASAMGPEGFQKDVVIKRIRSFLATDPGFVQMFIAEARLASRLNHPNIVQIFDFDKHDDTFYIAMEYVRGCSLWDMRRRCREQMVPVPPTLAAHLGMEVARGLHYAHQVKSRGNPVGLVHRDVTPHNVLLSWEGGVKLTDFGIAKAGNTLTSPGMLKGKFAYMSPEQARGDDVDPRTDVFALGIVLWELLTGGRLFEGDSDVAVLRAVQQSVIAPPARLNPDVPAELDAIVMRALERDLGGRYGSAQELERALGHFILRNAKSIDDTDVGGFLRRLFPEDSADERLDRTQSGLRETPPPSEPPEASPAPVRVREPTAVMPGRTPTPPAPAPISADEDAFGRTYVLDRSAAAGAEHVGHRTGFEQTAIPAPRGDVAVSPEGPSGSPHGLAAEAAPAAGQSREAVGAAPVADGHGAPVSGATAASHPEVESTAVAAAAIRRRSSVRAGVAVTALVSLIAIAGVSAVVTRGDRESDALPPTDAGMTKGVLGGEEPPDASAHPHDASEASPDAGSAPDAGTTDPRDAGAPPPLPPPPPPQDGGVGPLRAQGTLALNVTPWATLFIDGVNRGDVSGKQELVLPAGKYRVRIQHRRKRLDRTIVLKPGRRVVLTFDAFAD